MPDGSGKSEIPTFYANIVTSNLNVDEMTMELRWFAQPHRGRVKEGTGVTTVPPASPEELMAVEPVARVVLTFSAVKALKQYLDQALPVTENARKS
jgi:hypothetical protein